MREKFERNVKRFEKYLREIRDKFTKNFKDNIKKKKFNDQ